MRYATVAPNGRILGTFITEPALLPLRRDSGERGITESDAQRINSQYFQQTDWGVRHEA